MQTPEKIQSAQTLIQTISNGNNDGFKKFITEPINDAYSWGTYGTFRIIIRNADGFVNGVQLIREATIFENERRSKSGRKLLGKLLMKDWVKNDTTKDLVDTMNLHGGFLLSRFIDQVKGSGVNGEKFLQGTYIHPKLVNSLTTWVSPSYALVVADILEEYHLQAKLKMERECINNLRQDCSKKDDVIADLREMYNSISRDIKVSIRKNEILIEKLDTTNLKLDRVSNHLLTIAPNIRPKTRQPLEHLLIIARINTNDSGKMTHYAIRTIKRDRSINVKKISDRYEDFEIIREFESVNSIQIWNRIREECIYIRAKRNFFKLLIAEETVFEDFQRIILSAVEDAHNVCN